MANKILWDAKPTDAIIMAAASGPLRNLAAAGIAVSSEVTNGTALNTMGSFQLYVHDFAAAPAAGGYFSLHIVYQMDGTLYADGETGDVADPNLSAATLMGIFPVLASDEPQLIPLINVPLAPFDFKVCIVNNTSQAIPDTDNSTLTFYPYSAEVQ